MQCVLSRPELDSALSWIRQFCKPVRPVLDPVIALRANGNGRAVLTAHSGTVRSSVRLNGCQADGPIEIAFPVQFLLKALRVTADDLLTVTVTGERTSVAGRSARWTFAVPTTDPPAEVTAPDGPAWRTTGGSLRAIARRVLPFVARANTRYYTLGGVAIFREDDCAEGLTAVATDGYRPSVATLVCIAEGEPWLPDHACGNVIPPDLFQLAVNLAGEDDEVRLIWTARRDPSGRPTVSEGITIVTPNGVATALPVEGRYPTWRDALPGGEPAAVLSINDLTPLRDAIAALRSLESGEQKEINLEWANGIDPVVWSTVSESGDGTICVPALTGIGGPVATCLHAAHLAEALSAFAGDGPVRLEFRGPKTAVVLRGDQLLHVLSPISAGAAESPRFLGATPEAVA